MRIEQLQYFLETVKTGSFSATANNLYLSQQAVSDAIQKLEKELGFPLFLRYKKTIILTRKGEEFIQYAEELLEKYDNILNFSRSFERENLPAKSKLMIGSLIATPFIKEAFRSGFHNKHNLSLYESTVSDIMFSMSSNQAQYGILFLLPTVLATFQSNTADYITLIELFDDRVGWAMHKDSPIASEKQIREKDVPLKVEFSTTFYDYFSSWSSEQVYQRDIRSSDLTLHEYLMRNQNAICTTTEKLFPLFYNQNDFIVRFSSDEPVVTSGKFYLAINKNMITTETESVCRDIIALIKRLINTPAL